MWYHGWKDYRLKGSSRCRRCLPRPQGAAGNARFQVFSVTFQRTPTTNTKRSTSKAMPSFQSALIVLYWVASFVSSINLTSESPSALTVWPLRSALIRYAINAQPPRTRFPNRAYIFMFEKTRIIVTDWLKATTAATTKVRHWSPFHFHRLAAGLCCYYDWRWYGDQTLSFLWTLVVLQSYEIERNLAT